MKSFILQGLLLAAALFTGATVGKPGWVQAGKYRQQLQPMAPASSTKDGSVGHSVANPAWLASQTKTTALVTIDTSPDLASSAPASAKSGGKKAQGGKHGKGKPPRNVEDIIQVSSVGVVPSSAALVPGIAASGSGAKESFGAGEGDKTGAGKDVATTAEMKKEVIAAEASSAVNGKPDKVLVKEEDIPISEGSLEIATPEVRKGRYAIDDIVAGLASAGVQLAPATVETPIQKKKKKNLVGKKAGKVNVEEEDGNDASAASSNNAENPQAVEEEDGFVVDIPEMKKRPSRSQSPRADPQPVVRSRKESATGRSEGSDMNLEYKLRKFGSRDDPGKRSGAPTPTKNSDSEEEGDDDENDDSTYDRKASGRSGRKESKRSKITKRQRDRVNQDVRRVIRYLLKAVTVESILNIVASEYKRGKYRRAEDDDESLEDVGSEEDTRPRRKTVMGRQFLWDK